MRYLRRVNRGEIVLGKPVAMDLFDSKRKVILRSGYAIESEKRLKDLILSGLFYEGHLALGAYTDMEEEIRKSPPFELIEKTRTQLRILLNNIETIEGFQSEIMGLSEQIQMIYEKDADAAISTIFGKKDREYGIAHSIDSAFLCEVIAKRLHDAPKKRRSLIAAALTMNVGMLELQAELFFQAEPLTETQKESLEHHQHTSVEILNHCGVTDEIWLNTILQHHEYLDGSGYPKGLEAEEITPFSRILTIADIYSAKVSNRGYRETILPNTGLREIFLGARGQAVDPELVKILVKDLGVYPPGTFVRLTNGEIAIVTHRGKEAHEPVVRSVKRRTGMPFPKPIKRDCASEDFSIKEVIPERECNIEIDRHELWGYRKK